MAQTEYEFEVAFSFLSEDEHLAEQLHNLLAERLTVFLYSKRQEEIAGTDGEETFGKVFREQARIVVVLYRPGWGETPWTRIEETAIRNRGYDEGYDFVLFIPLEQSAPVPKWLPKTQLWVDLERWGPNGAASAIEIRVQQSGGSPRRESLEEKAGRLKREIDTSEKRKQFLSSDAGVRAAKEELRTLQGQLEAQVAVIREKAGFDLTIECQGNEASLLSTKFGLAVDWTGSYANTLEGSSLDVTLFLGRTPRTGMIFPFDKPKKLRHREFHFEGNYLGPNGWQEARRPEFLSTERLAELCVTILIEAEHSDKP